VLNIIKTTTLIEKQKILAHNGNSSFTTLVQSDRWSTRYLNMLAGSGALISRNIDEILSACHELDLKTARKIKGNLAFITLQ
jgi:hypothetical protein